MKKTWIIFLAAAVSCADFEFDQTIEFKEAEPLQIYVDAFYEEARMRGVVLEKENLIVEFGDLPHSGVSREIGRQRVVLIDKGDFEYITKTRENPYWGIENLVFHELGHALLDRDHCDPCYSIMARGLSLFEYENDSTKRNSLLDELFLVNNSHPSPIKGG